MRLYLSSFDLGDQPDQLVALIGAERRVAVIVNALDNRPQARALWLKRQADRLAGLGFVVEELDLRDYFGKAEKLGDRLQTVDAVWINGGNTFILRRAMKQSGFDTLIKGALAHDRIVYAGFSAAAVILYDSLRGLEITDDPNDVPPGYDSEIVWQGLGLIPFALAVHFKSDHSETESTDREIAFYEANAIPYRTLRDGEALVVHGHEEKILAARADR